MNRAATQPLVAGDTDEVILIHRDRPVTAGEALAAAQTLAGQLPGAPYCICLCKNRYSFTVALLACLIRRTTLLLPPNKQRGAVDAIAERYPGSVCLYSESIDLQGRPAVEVPEEATAGDVSQTAPIPQIEAEHLAVIAFTSGSTGTPSPNAKTWGSLVATTGKLRRRFFAEGPRPTIVATVPSQHMYGLEMTVMMALHGGCTVDTGQPFLPGEVLDRLNAVSRPRVLVTTPVHMRALCSVQPPWPPVGKIVSATAPLATDLAGRVESGFDGTVEEIYGCTEAGSSATRRTVDGNRWRLLDGMYVNERDEGVYIDGDHLQGPVLLQDRLNVLSDTEFEFLARAQDMLNVGGKRASLADLTEKVLAIDGVEDAVVFMPDDPKGAVERPAALVVSRLSEQAIRRAISDTIDPVFAPRPLKKVERLPRGEHGKLQREKLLELLESDHAKRTD